MTITVRPQNPYEAFATLWSVLLKMPFYIQNGYADIALPDDTEITNLANNPSELQHTKPETLGNRFIQNIYKLSDYKIGVDNINSEIKNITKSFPVLKKLNASWGFKLFPQYTIILTLYGPGGSYNSETGTILIRTSVDGKFQNPQLQNIIHEMTHLGIEDNIVKKYNLTHNEKESLVNIICRINFSSLFGSPNDEKMANNPFVSLLTTESINNLPQIIENYISTHPRK